MLIFYWKCLKLLFNIADLGEKNFGFVLSIWDIITFRYLIWFLQMRILVILTLFDGFSKVYFPNGKEKIYGALHK